MVISCWVKGCTNRLDGKVKRGFYSIPAVREHEGEYTKKLTYDRRQRWLSNINRKKMPSKHAKICSDHFLHGKPSSMYERDNPDWAPTLNLNNTSGKSVKKTKEEVEADLKRKRMAKLHKKSYSRCFTRKKGAYRKKGASKKVIGFVYSNSEHKYVTDALRAPGPEELVKIEPTLEMVCDEVEVWNCHSYETDISSPVENVNNNVLSSHVYSDAHYSDQIKWNEIGSGADSDENVSDLNAQDFDRGKRIVIKSEPLSSEISYGHLSDSTAQDFDQGEHKVIASDTPSAAILHGNLSDSNTQELDQGEQKVTVSDSLSPANFDRNFRDHLRDHNYLDGIPPNIVLSNRSLYEELKQKCMHISQAGNFTLLYACEYIRYIKVYDSDFPAVKVCVTVDKTFNPQIKVHNTDLPSNHELWCAIPIFCNSVSDVAKLLSIVDTYEVCQGNSDSHLVDLVSLDSSLHAARVKKQAVYKDSSTSVPTVRSTSCQYLIKSRRCTACTLDRRTLAKVLSRHKEAVVTTNPNLVSSTIPDERLSEAQQIEKIKQLRMYANSLQSEIGRLNRKINRCMGENHDLTDGKIAEPSEHNIVET